MLFYATLALAMLAAYGLLQSIILPAKLTQGDIICSVLHFTLFIIAYVETHRRNSAKTTIGQPLSQAPAPTMQPWMGHTPQTQPWHSNRPKLPSDYSNAHTNSSPVSPYPQNAPTSAEVHMPGTAHVPVEKDARFESVAPQQYELPTRGQPRHEMYVQNMGYSHAHELNTESR